MNIKKRIRGKLKEEFKLMVELNDSQEVVWDRFPYGMDEILEKKIEEIIIEAIKDYSDDKIKEIDEPEVIKTKQLWWHNEDVFTIESEFTRKNIVYAVCHNKSWFKVFRKSTLVKQEDKTEYKQTQNLKENLNLLRKERDKIVKEIIHKIGTKLDKRWLRFLDETDMVDYVPEKILDKFYRDLSKIYEKKPDEDKIIEIIERKRKEKKKNLTILRTYSK